MQDGGDLEVVVGGADAAVVPRRGQGGGAVAETASGIEALFQPKNT